MSTAACAVLALALLDAPVLSAAPFPQRAVFVEGGEPKLLLYQGKEWTRGDGYLEGSGKGNDLLAGKEIGAGNFRLKARLRFLKLAKSAAAFRLGNGYFGFEGASGETFLSGPMFGGLRSLGPSSDFVKGDTWLDFGVSRTGDEIQFAIDGKTVHTHKHNAQQIGPLALHPWRATIQVSEFSAEAENMTDATPPMAPGYTIPIVDLADETHRQVIVDREPGQYLGHPTTVLLDDNKTMIAVYPKGHGRGAIVMKKSFDAGLTWTDRLPVPENWATSLEVPTIYPTEGPDGKKRLIMFSGLYPIRMARSEDDGETWTPLEPIGDFGGIVAMADCIRLKDGRYRAFFHDDGRFLKGSGKRGPSFQVFSTVSADGGLTWSEPEVVCEHFRAHLCEPGVVRSPAGNQLAMLLRENSRQYNSFVVFSDDEGETWSKPRELPASLTGDRHQCLYAPDGRLFISFRDTTRQSPTKGDWVGWVGTYDDIVEGREGQYRVRLMDNTKGADCSYPAVECLPDGTFVCTTYGHWTEGEAPYIVSVRFKIEELDAKARWR